MSRFFIIRSLMLILVFTLTACSSNPTNTVVDRDPWETLNRKIFVFNDTADQYVLVPVAKGYRAVTPDFLEVGISNFFSNLRLITTIGNDVLQLKFKQAGKDAGRFLVNSTVGILGFVDVASQVGLEKHKQDFGLTLAHWGLDSGPYVMLPFLGPSTVRDGFGRYVDSATTNYSDHIDHIRTRNQLTVVDLIDTRAGLLKAGELVTGDRYVFIRDVYLQYRDGANKQGPVEDTFGDEDYSDFDDWEE